jgi:hypothetical protein
MAFNRTRVVELVEEFYRANDAEAGTRFEVVSNLNDALEMASVSGPDGRLADASVRQTAMTVQELDEDHRVLRDVHELVFRHVVIRRSGTPRFRVDGSIVISAGYTGGLPGSLGEACRNGLGWLIAADRTAIIVPTPVVRVAEGRPDVIHDDTGRMAVVWPDGHGYYFLHGSEFNKRLYFQVINHDLLIQDIAALDNADQRAIALQYLTFEQLVLDSDAEVLDRGVRGTVLYRLALPPRIARDRKPDYGGFDYFIHMRDASHPEREFIEWVDPQIGRQRNAELCQANAFGISLDDWLSIEQEG